MLLNFTTIRDDFSKILRQILFHRKMDSTAAPRKDIRPNFFEGIYEAWNCGLVGVSITCDNRKCSKNRKLTEKQWDQPDVIFLFSQICRIQTKNIGILPEMTRSIWFWSQISINFTRNEKNRHFFQSLWFLTLKYDFFRVLPVTGNDQNPYQATISTLVYVLKKSLD